MKRFAIMIVLYPLFLWNVHCAFAQVAGIDVKFQGEKFSARFQDVPLKSIFERLTKEKEIWFKGDSSLLDEKVTVQFTDLDLQDGMKRILSYFDYCLVFGGDKGLSGVIIIGKKKSEPVEAGSGVSPTREPPQLGDKGEPSAVEEPFKIVRNSPPGGPAKASAEELANLKVTKNVPPPGGPVQITEEELENLKVIKNCPPPGGPVTVDREAIENLKIIRNCPPPGD